MPTEIGQRFVEGLREAVRLEPEGTGRYRVFTPFMFDDGDCFGILLKQEGSRWVLTDEGHTFMHLALGVDEREMLRGTRHDLIRNALSAFAVEDRNGELVLPVEEEDFAGGLTAFVQAIGRIVALSYLTRERVRSTFFEDGEHDSESRSPRQPGDA